MSKAGFLKAASHYFENNATAKEFYFTADEQAFDNKSNAMNHARSLDDKEIVTITRAEATGDAGDVEKEKDEKKAGLKKEIDELGKKKAAQSETIAALDEGTKEHQGALIALGEIERQIETASAELNEL